MKIFFTLLTVIILSYSTIAQKSVSYILSMPQPHTHYFEVEMLINDISAKTLDIKMPVWAPGSYLVREFARNVEDFSSTALNGKIIPYVKVTKNCWRLNTAGQKEISIKYKVYANELSVRTSFINSEFGYINGTSVFMFIDKQVQLPCSLKINLFKDWKKVSTNLDKISDNIYTADNYDVFADCPIQMGNHVTFDFTAAGIKHEVALVGEGNYQIDTLKREMAKVVNACTSVVGENPNKSYTFIVHNLTIPSGGLEHLSSTTLQVNRFTYQPRANLIKFLTLVAHEYFHLWNVKRIRPIALGPFDYDNENYTNLLFISEGFTSYYEELLMVKAGYKKPSEYLDYMAGTIGSVEISPGNKVQSASESSFDAWIKGYRPNENSSNSTISYYGKGESIAVLLDLAIINATKGRKNLDDLMKYLYFNYYKEKKRGFSDEEFKTAAELVAGVKLDELFESIYTTKTPDYKMYFNYAGVNLVIVDAPEKNKVLFGASLQDAGGRLMVKSVQRGTAAYDDGLNFDDEIISVDGYRVNQDKFTRYLQGLNPGDVIKILISRDDVLKEIKVTLRGNHLPKYYLVDDANKTAEQLTVFKKWMRP
jgi:predicted metalloprotease with PDZ domain